MGVDIYDASGQPPSLADIANAIKVVQTALVRYVMKMPPEVAVELPNILRCLHRLRELESKS